MSGQFEMDIEVGADTRQFENTINALLKKFKPVVAVQVNQKAFEKSLDNAVKIASKKSIEVAMGVNTAELQKEVTKAAEEVSKKAKINLVSKIDPKQLQNNIEDAIEKIERRTGIKISPAIDAKKLEKALTDALQAVENKANAKIGLTVDAKKVEQSINAALQKIENKASVKIGLTVDTKKLEDSVNKATSAIGQKANAGLDLSVKGLEKIDQAVEGAQKITDAFRGTVKSVQDVGNELGLTVGFIDKVADSSGTFAQNLAQASGLVDQLRGGLANVKFPDSDGGLLSIISKAASIVTSVTTTVIAFDSLREKTGGTKESIDRLAVTLKDLLGTLTRVRKEAEQGIPVPDVTIIDPVKLRQQEEELVDFNNQLADLFNRELEVKVDTTAAQKGFEKVFDVTDAAAARLEEKAKENGHKVGEAFTNGISSGLQAVRNLLNDPLFREGAKIDLRTTGGKDLAKQLQGVLEGAKGDVRALQELLNNLPNSIKASPFGVRLGKQIQAEIKKASEAVDLNKTIFGVEAGGINFGEFLKLPDFGAVGSRLTRGVSQLLENFKSFFSSRARSAGTAVGESITTGVLNAFESKFKTVAASIGKKIVTVFKGFFDFATVLGASGTVFTSLVATLGALAPAIAGLTAVVGPLGAVFFNAAGAASQANEALNATRVTLGAASRSFEEATKNISSFGLTSTQAQQAIVPIAALFKNAGLAGEELSENIQSLLFRAIDLSSVFNTEVPDAIQAIAAALRGETDPIERFGVSISAVEVDAKAAALGFKKVAGEFDSSAKIIARSALLLEKTQIFAGDFQNTSNSLANQQRVLRATLAQTRLEISQQFLPAAQKIAAALIVLVKEVGPDLTDLFRNLRPVIDATGTVFGATVKTISALTQAFAATIRALTPFGQVFEATIRGTVGVATGLVKTIQEIGSQISNLAKTTSATGISRFFNAGQLAATGFGAALKVVVTTLQLLLLRFLALRVATTVIGGLSAASTLLAARLNLSAAAALRLNAAITGLTGPLALVIAVIGAFAVRTAKANQEADKLVATITKDLDFSAFEGLPGQVDDFTVALERANKILDEQKKKVDDSTRGFKKFLPFDPDAGFLDNLNPFSPSGEEKAKRAAAKTAKEIQDIIRRQSIRDTVTVEIETNLKQKGIQSFDQTDILQALKAKGIDPANISYEKMDAIINQITSDLTAQAGAFRGVLIPSVEEYKTLIQEAQAAFDAALQSANSLVDAQASLEAAQDRVKDIDKQIAEAVAERDKILKGTGKTQEELAADAKKEADARKNIARIEEQISDLLRERNRLREDEAIRAREFNEEQESFADRLRLADLDIADAKRRAEEAQLALNTAVRQGVEEETPSVNLAGLNLDQIRAKLANVRATLAAQKAAKKVGAQDVDQGKTRVELEEDAERAAIAVRDAERSRRDLLEENQQNIVDNQRAQEDFAESIEESLINERDLRDQIKETQQEILDLQKPEIANKKEIERLDKSILDLGKQRVTASNAVADAENRVQRAVALSAGDYATVARLDKELAQSTFGRLRDTRLITDEFNRQLGIYDQQGSKLRGLQEESKKFFATLTLEGRQAFNSLEQGLNDFANSLKNTQNLPTGGLLGPVKQTVETAITENAKKQIISLLPALLQNAKSVLGGFPLPLNDQVLNLIAGKILESRDTDLLRALREALESIGFKIPGLQRGGIVEGTTGPSGQLVRVGENGKAEAILPLTNLTDFTRVLTQAVDFASPDVKTVLERIIPVLALDIVSVIKKLIDTVNAVIRKASLNIPEVSVPGFADGGLIKGSGPMGTLIRAGENSRLEAVLPVTRPAKMDSLMKDSRILDPVLASLQRISLPGSGVDLSATAPRLQSAPPASINVEAARPSATLRASRQERRKEQSEFASMIAAAVGDEFEKRGVGTTNDLDVNVTAPPGTDVNLIVRKVVREIEKKFDL